MEIYIQYIQELLWLNDAIIKKYDELMQLESRNVYINYYGCFYPSNYVIEQKMKVISKMKERKIYLEEILNNLSINDLNDLYKYVAEKNMGREKIIILCYIFELIDNTNVERGR